MCHKLFPKIKLKETKFSMYFATDYVLDIRKLFDLYRAQDIKT